MSLKVAVVGSGPAGFYTADALLKSEEPHVAVDLIDRLPTPWGLVRLGVAPDHENIKAVSRAFEKTAARPGFRFFGNVEVGSTVSHEELLAIYDAVVYTVGAQTDRRLGVPGEDLPGLVARHGVRGLVQRPPRLPGPRLRPRLRAGRRDRERQRRDRLRADARAHCGGAGADRHDRRGRRRDRGVAGARDPDARPPWAGAGGVHAAGAEGAGGDARCRAGRRRARSRARRRQQGRIGGGPRSRSDGTSTCFRSTRRASRKGRRGRSFCGSSSRRSRSSARSASKRSRSCATSSSRRAEGSSRGRRARSRRSRAGSCCAASATRAWRCPVFRSTSAAG